METMNRFSAQVRDRAVRMVGNTVPITVRNGHDLDVREDWLYEASRVFRRLLSVRRSYHEQDDEQVFA